MSNSSLNIDDNKETNDLNTDYLEADDDQMDKNYNENVSDHKSGAPVYAKIHPDRVKVSNHEAMKENNSRMDNMWDNVLNSSNLSLHLMAPNNNK